MNVFELFGTIAIKNRDANAALKDTTTKAEKTSKQIQEAFKKIGSASIKVGKAVIGGATAIGTAFAATVESTRDYRTAMAKLDAAFIANGHSAETAYNTYKGLQRVLGDTDQATEAANHLAVLCKNEQELDKWTDICTGVFATFGDSLPIEGLTEAANETSKTGQLTGSLADALNWAGINEEDFQKKLDACTSEQERQQLIMNTLFWTYKEASEQYKKTGESVMKANEAQEKLNAAMAKIGEIGEPIMTGLKSWVADMVTAAVPHLETLVEKLANFGQTMSLEVWPWLQKEAKAKLGIELPAWPKLQFKLTKWWTDTKVNIEEIAKASMSIIPPDWTKLKENISTNLSTLITPEMEESLRLIGEKIQKAFGTGTEAASTVLNGAKDFGQWCVDNKEKVGEFFSILAGETLENTEGAASFIQLAADAIKGLTAIGTEAVTGALQWVLEHGEAVAFALEAMSVGLAMAAIAAHPYAAAITAAAAALGLMKEYGGEDRYDHFFGAYSDEELAKLQEYVDAAKELEAAQQAVYDALDRGEDAIPEDDAVKAARANLEAIKAEIDEGLIGIYNSWNTGQDGYTQGMYFDIPARLAEGTEAAIQNEVSSMSLSADVKLYPDYSAMGDVYNYHGGSGRAVAESRASGLDYVPRDGYFARLHKGEAILNSAQADEWRGSGSSRIEALLAQLIAIISAGQMITLDSGVMAGQLAPAIDARLGTITARKGRGN